jgi:hypothetical protein
VPINTGYLLQSPHIGNFLEKLDSTQFFKENLFSVVSPLDHIFHLTELTKLENSLICLVPKEKDGFDYLMISDAEPVFQIDSMRNKILETLKFQDYDIKKLTAEGFTTFSSRAGNTYLASNSLDLLKKAMTSEENKIMSPAFEMVYAAADNKRTSLFINHKILDDQLSKIFSILDLPLKNLASWSVVDIEITGDNFLFNGVVTSKAGLPQILDLFEGVAAENNELSKITPSDAVGFFSFTYEDFKNIYRNLNNFRNDSIQLSPNHLLNFTKEAGIIYGEQDVFVLNTTDLDLAMDSFNDHGKTSEFRGITIKETAHPNQFSLYLKPLIKKEGLKYYASVENFLIFSETVKAIENIITNFQNNTTLEKQEYYREAITNLANSSSYLMVANTSSIKNRLQKNISEEFEEDLDNFEVAPYSIAALQLVKDQNFAHLHGVLRVSQNVDEEGVRQITSIKLNARPVIQPILIGGTNPSILVQDINNVLHLFNSSGELQWKKQLESAILKEVHEVGLSANGNVNIAFTTLNNLHLLDLKGKPVKPFPVLLKNEITLPLGVFDYDNNKNYRFAITQKNNLILYDSKGKIVKGFDFEKTESEILKSPKHLRLKNKDYIIFPESTGKLNILSRQGNQRVKVKDEIEPSGQEWYEHKGKFVSATPQGDLVLVDEGGNIEKRSVAGNANLQLSATEKNLVILSENKLTINAKEIVLDFGLYTRPEIFELNNKTYISITDTQAQRVYVFDENANLYDGFPVYGNSSADIKAFKGFSVYLLVQGEEGEIILYRL